MLKRAQMELRIKTKSSNLYIFPIKGRFRNLVGILLKNHPRRARRPQKVGHILA